MFCLFDDVQYEIELIGQKKVYADEYDYVGVTTIARSIHVYVILFDNRDETIPVANMADIYFNVPDYLVEYWTDENMVVLTDVRFLEVEYDFCCLESTRNGLSRVYRVSKGDFIWRITN